MDPHTSTVENGVLVFIALRIEYAQLISCAYFQVGNIFHVVAEKAECSFHHDTAELSILIMLSAHKSGPIKCQANCLS